LKPAGIRSTVSGASPTLLIPSLSHELIERPAAAVAPAPIAALAAGAAPAPAIASAGMADIDAMSAARGIVIAWPHFLQWPRLPAMRASTSNRAPQLWQKNTMGMEFPLRAGRWSAPSQRQARPLRPTDHVEQRTEGLPKPAPY